MRGVLIAVLILAFGLDAAAQKRRRRPPPNKPSITMPETVPDQLSLARKLAEELDYPEVVTLTEAVIADPKASAPEKLEAYRLLGSAQAFMGNPLEAESAFRFLLRGNPDFEFPEGTSPKITWVFRKVQHEEQEILKQTEEMRRARVASAMELGLDAPKTAKGGEPLQFKLRIKDPFGAVEVASLHYRRSEERRFSQLPLKLNDNGLWVASLPAEWTANDGGATVEYFIGAEDSSQTLLRAIGNESDPLELTLEAGQPPSNEPITSQWWFWTGTVAAVVGAGVAAFFLIDARTSVPSGDVDPVSLD